MASLRDEARDYVPKQTLNIADLDRVDLSLPVEDRSGVDKEGREFKYKVMVVNEQEFRVPNSVLEKIQEIIKLRPDVNFIKVKSTGSGLSTKYSVDILEE